MIPSPHGRRRFDASTLLVSAILAVPALVTALVFLAAPAQANNYGESYGWQFHSSADRANQALILDLMEKRRGGYYRAPSYTTTIERQYNCGITATATGNDGAQSAVANSPSVSGPTALATGNQSDTVLNGRGGQGGSRAGSWQSNSGSVSAGVDGSASASVRGHADQALNSNQTNSGPQAATVSGSSACAFGGGR